MPDAGRAGEEQPVIDVEIPETCDGDHSTPFDPTDEDDRKQFALMTEGVCPTCNKPAGRTDDGFAACSCCGVEWTLDGHHVLVRFDVSFMLVEASS